MHTLHKASVAKTARLREAAADAKEIVKTLREIHENHQQEGGDRLVVQLVGYTFDAIRKAADQLNEAGFVVEYGFSCTELANHGRARAIAVETRAGFINRQVLGLGLGFRVGAVVGAIGTLCGLVAHLHGDPGRYCYTAMGVMIALWLCSESTLKERRVDRRAKLERQRWSPIERTDATDCIRA